MKALKRLTKILVGLLVLLLVWGVVEPYLIDEEPFVVEVPRLPAAWENRKVVQLSDWQVGMWLDNELTVRRIISRLLEERPALVLLTGDFIYKSQGLPRASLQKVEELIAPLGEAGIPVYAVLGNHDYGVGSPGQPPVEERAEAVRQVLQEAGVDVLKNEAVPLPVPAGTPDTLQDAEPLHLVGIGSHWAGMDDPAKAVAELPDEAPRLVMMHHPDSFAGLPALAAPFAVAGHTHGGQVSLPFTPRWTWLTYVKADRIHADGWITRRYGADGNRLYVNRGIGFSVLPLRIHCQPELTMFTLRRMQ